MKKIKIFHTAECRNLKDVTEIKIFHTAECTFGVYTLHLLHYNFGFHMKKIKRILPVLAAIVININRTKPRILHNRTVAF